LFPLLFNLTLDLIIEQLSSGITELKYRDISIFAFADDMTLINITTSQKQLTILYNYLRKMGMELSIEKCSIFHIKPSNKTWYQVDSKIQVEPELRPYANSKEVIKYLRVKVRPWIGLDRTVNIESITREANNKIIKFFDCVIASLYLTIKVLCNK